MSIRDMDDFISQLWDWSIFDGCFGESKIQVTDIDGLVERKGEFLLIETKRHSSTPIPMGQKIMFDALVIKKGFVVLIIYGEPGNPTAMQVWRQDKVDANLNDVRMFVSDWYQKANM